MADEIRITSRITLTNGNFKHTFAPGNIDIDQAAVGYYDAIHNIGTSEESVGTFQDVSSEGIIVVHNMDATNYVQVGFATTVYGMRLTADSPLAIFNAEPSLTLYLKANTAACNVRIICYEA